MKKEKLTLNFRYLLKVILLKYYLFKIRINKLEMEEIGIWNNLGCILRHVGNTGVNP